MAEGTGVDGGGPVAHDHIETLGREECVRRLAAHGVARIGVEHRGGVGIFPVNYVLDGDSVVVRVRPDGVLDEATRGTLVAIEIDHADTMYHEGWSVLVQGRCTHVSDPGERDSLGHLPLLPWGGSDRDLYLRVAMERVSGRHIHHREH